jgi:hypothetical protein
MKRQVGHVAIRRVIRCVGNTKFQFEKPRKRNKLGETGIVGIILLKLILKNKM